MWTRLSPPGAAGRVADHPSDGIAAGDGAELLTRLQSDVGDAPWRGINVVDTALAEGIDLRGLDVSGLRGPDRRLRIRGGNDSAPVAQVARPTRLRGYSRATNHREAGQGLDQIRVHGRFLRWEIAGMDDASVGSSGDPSGRFVGDRPGSATGAAAELAGSSSRVQSIAST